MKNQKEKDKKKSFSINKIDPENIITIEGIKIYFPYKAYQVQIDYMTKVIQTLNKGNNISALESPTGTGKTLCLLCSILGWLQQKNDKNENININNVYYCTKTVSQISNASNELSETCYKVKNSFLASRKFSCNYFNYA